MPKTTDQSGLNRFLTHVPAGTFGRSPTGVWNFCTRTSGVIAIDTALIDHEGKLIEDVGDLWDHADKRHLIAHDDVICTYGCPSGKHYPLEFRRFRKKDQCDAQRIFRDHNELVRELIDWVCQRDIPGEFTFDSDFTTAFPLNHLHDRNRGDGGT